MSVDSNVASGWPWHVSGVWIEASISVAAASGNSWFNGVAAVGQVECTADSGWIASVQSGGVVLVLDCSVDGDRGTLSVASC